MKRYWDLTEMERAKLSDEEVKMLEAVELMEGGVLRPVPPKLQAEPDVQVETTTCYTLNEVSEGRAEPLEITFASREDADKVAAMPIFLRKKSYDAPARFVHETIRVIPEPLATEDSIAKQALALSESYRIAEANKSERYRFDRENGKVREKLKSLRENLRACRAEYERLGTIRTTYAEYLKMADGNEEMAKAFLAKAFDEELIKEALSSEYVAAPKPDDLPSVLRDIATPSEPFNC
jgi:hypothetical protein